MNPVTGRTRHNLRTSSKHTDTETYRHTATDTDTHRHRDIPTHSDWYRHADTQWQTQTHTDTDIQTCRNFHNPYFGTMSTEFL